MTARVFRVILGIAAAAVIAHGCASERPIFDSGTGPPDGDTGGGADTSLDAGMDAADAPVPRMDAGTDAMDTAIATDAGDDAASAPDASTDASAPDAATARGYVWAHSDTELYRVDAVSLEITRVGTFTFPDSLGGDMLDLAVTRELELWGVTGDVVWRIDPATAACTRVTDRAGAGFLNALTFLPAASPGARERLVAATETGGFYEIDRATGAATLIGEYGLNVGSSGDIVSVAGAGTYATVIGGDGYEYLARIDSATGATTTVGRVAIPGIWGLGYWGGTLYGFTTGGRVISIDPSTAATAVVGVVPDVVFWGAGVTTMAPLTHGGS